MKIMFCTGTLLSGGTERVICNLSNYLIDCNEIKIVSLANTEIAYELDRKIEVEFLDDTIFENEIKKKKRITKNLKRILKLRKSIYNYRPDVIISFGPEPAFLTLLLKKFNKITTVISVRNDPKIEYGSKIYKFLMKILYPSADGVVFQTEDAKDYFKNIIKCSKIVIPNPINESFIIEPFNQVRKKEIVNVGRLQEQKNQKMLINAFSKLPSKYNEYKLRIYGEGYLRSELAHLIEELNLEDRVILEGSVKNIKERIYDSALFVLSSDYEGMPNALMEAMTLGMPVISTDCPCGGPKFLIDNNENGILIKVNDEKGLTNAIEKVLSDEKFSAKLQNNAIKIQETLNPKKINKIWYDYILDINTKKITKEKKNN